MTKLFNLICVCALLLLPSLASAAKKSELKLESKSYAEARKIISSYGWQTFKEIQYCSSHDPKDSCEATPELSWCRAALNCEISFYKDDQCLYVNVRGGPRWNSYKVTKVTFARWAKNCPSKE